MNTILFSNIKILPNLFLHSKAKRKIASSNLLMTHWKKHFNVSYQSTTSLPIGRFLTTHPSHATNVVQVDGAALRDLGSLPITEHLSGAQGKAEAQMSEGLVLWKACFLALLPDSRTASELGLESEHTGAQRGTGIWGLTPLWTGIATLKRRSCGWILSRFCGYHRFFYLYDLYGRLANNVDGTLLLNFKYCLLQFGKNLYHYNTV